MAFPASNDDNGFPQDLAGPPDYRIPPPDLTFLQRLLFRRPEAYVDNMKKMLGASAAGMGRQPTQQEVDVLCQIAYKEAQTAAWAIPLSIGLSAYLTFRGRATYRFPFFQPKFDKFSPDVFPAAAAPYLQGRLANRMWHNLRFVSYFAGVSICVGPFIGSYATSVAIATAARDDRLGQFRKDMKPERLVQVSADKMPPSVLARQRQRTAAAISGLERELAKFPSEEQVRQKAGAGDAEKELQSLRETVTYVESKIAEYRRILEHIDGVLERKNGGGGDDAAAQVQDYEALAASGSAGAYPPLTESDGNAPMTYSRSAPSSENRPGWGWGKPSSPSSPQAASSSASSDDLDYDDASPVTPAARAQPAAAPTGSGSSWERLRQASRQNARAPDQSGQSERPNNDYTYDPVDMEKNAAQDKAQKEFDDMLERERRGDGGRGSDRNSRW
ncbi:hypothetical protein EsH8_X_000186 [Colletotrichum jinshuiense]